MAALTPDAVRSWHYRLLRAATATADGDGLIDGQPCRVAGAGSPRPSVERRELAERLLTPGQVREVAAGMAPRYPVQVLAAAWSGLRQGELLALTRADLDLDAVPPVVRVRRRVRRNDDGSTDVDTPKSTDSVRTVALPGPLRDAIVDHLDEFAGEGDDAMVFATVNGTVAARSNLSEMLHPWAGLRGVTSLHILRMRGPIEAFLDGELTAAEAERVRRHHKQCWYCSGAVDVGCSVRAALRQMQSPRSLADVQLRRFAASLDADASQRR